MMVLWLTMLSLMDWLGRYRRNILNKTEIYNSLKEKFNSTLSDGECRKIIYWIDTDHAFEDIFNELKIDAVKKHHLLENNYFHTKYILEEVEPDSNYLIYTTENLDINIDNWLSDNILYSTKFYADCIFRYT